MAKLPNPNISIFQAFGYIIKSYSGQDLDRNLYQSHHGGIQQAGILMWLTNVQFPPAHIRWQIKPSRCVAVDFYTTSVAKTVIACCNKSKLLQAIVIFH